MNVTKEVLNAFQAPVGDQFPSNEFIEANPNILELRDPADLLSTVPAYILWCLNNPISSSLVPMYTIGALAEYGRHKSSENPYLNFKFLCNEAQAKAVARFLEWCKHNQPFEDRKQIERALLNWQHAANKSMQPTPYRRG